MGKRIKPANFSREIGKLISFDSKYRPYFFIFVLMILSLIPVSTIENAPELSICKRVLKENCPSAGITRGVSSLLKGQVNQAINYNWLSIPTLITMISIIVIDIYKKLKKQNSQTKLKSKKIKKI
jgi:L-lactate permease